ncbi:16S rRNA methyltransferase [Thermosipho melanesiensis]|uniref:Ribosomal RNA small subunit methyltransferase H n=2 Tax=Thermosipho melanesiensis TaxID=46541 RepID=RSMH_THEM4|nr:16S rRNA (cytosine(1402)-N(4))-methyltransferase RsmH [Thermosipho melanesiensis]A6LNR5.1 RecName: Full=Ribosomal RNA small subunit methyltransferase H; AltName: Full=16S rRNA m(4)C1402 methyltransferase; AltName: Full=rRNA (cytosine-N(4)-)-methyltransferase RsmH [Thermosipho melanesiensis BI429]ABR31566.1 S-adenosyl-methyltransferase MraW [Thermosipho melanesiensis BI429]APT74599.1 16S rRNA methyltransferase [Thermosipho melanesiensis]OOC35303.1 16S rRNA methyltransferase [Thermosipho melan
MRKYNDKHIPVLPNEVVEYLLWKDNGIYVDCTAGEGGHTFLIAKKCPNSRVIAIDVDLEVLEIAQKNLKAFHNVILLKASYVDLPVVLKSLGIERVSGILADLGISTYQLKAEGRGFSFNRDEPLDMRMDIQQDTSAHKITNFYSEEKLSKIIFKYGEERFARRIAKQIVKNRPINTTKELVEIIKKALPPSEIRKRKRHFATKTFQAIRIEVNKELKNIEQLLKNAEELLEIGGRLAIISFHSLEDRIVKHFIKNSNNLKHIAGPIKPTQEETKNNPRARSAKLRVAERI